MRNMKRMTMLLALAVSLMMVLAVVPAAAKGGKPEKPPKPPTAVPVAVHLIRSGCWRSWAWAAGLAAGNRV